MKKTVCVDLDDVLADYSKGWQGEDVIGDPIPGAVNFTHELKKFAYVVIFTTRCKTDLPWGRSPDCTPESLQARILAWLNQHGFAFDEVYIGQGKPIAAAYVDDRAVECAPRKYLNAFQRALEMCRGLCKDH